MTSISKQESKQLAVELNILKTSYSMARVKNITREAAILLRDETTNELFFINEVLSSSETRNNTYMTLVYTLAKSKCKQAAFIARQLARSVVLKPRVYQTIADYYKDLEDIHFASSKIVEATTLFQDRFKID